jgi:hypothetical protein
MSVCRRCGSIKTQRIQGSTLERILAHLLRQQVLFCGRCGWRGRVKPMDSGDRGHDRRRHRRRGRHQPATPDLTEPVDPIDLDALDKALGTQPPPF